MSNKLKIACALLLFLLPLQLCFSLTTYFQHQTLVEQSVASVQTRIALDLPRLSLPNDKLHIVGNPFAVTAYLDKINQQLLLQELPVQVVSLQAISAKKSNVSRADSKRYQLLTPDNQVEIKLIEQPLPFIALLSVWPWLLSIVGVYLSKDHIKSWRNPEPAEPEVLIEQEPLKILINLQNKMVINSVTQHEVPLANKPLCFYIALMEFCQNNKDITLNQNKDVPEELVELANKYFYRLIDLGHIVRKRPNFTNSLEKTLSEIRAALDEVFAEHPEEKEIYYPPKAHGEGSRSKLHHYGLNKIDKIHFEVIGK
ncbi:hypothetical protein [Pseudoalteromonas tunicata]|uniref:hypothetical protein n=1 Tax=Pseudoalteromonas tunicata TaxID=314281 RepID=UPI00273E1C31|nr:hypothetical protein [Pseudoalteromonas tunicata]MDP4983945.1 hypothetical protein [Pseudoalteromonas tunicata]MDP5213936.1 hypothetical protein [Pseudoalteromonas tunicata]